jgi:hypothetical protein
MSQSNTSWKSKAVEPHSTFTEVQSSYSEELNAEDEFEESNPYRRFEYFWKDRVNSNDPQIDGFLRGYQGTIDQWLHDNQYCDEGDEAFWNFAGPFGENSDVMQNIGRITAVWSDPTNVDRIICGGDESSGIWFTDDHGQTWTNRTDELRMPALGISQLIGRADNNLIIAACGNTNLMRRPYGPGLLYSNDHGLTWNIWASFEMPDNVSIEGLNFSLKYPNVLFGIWKEGYSESLLILNTGSAYNEELDIEGGEHTILPIQIVDADLGWANDIRDLAVIKQETQNEIVERIFVASAAISTYSAVIAYSDDYGLNWTNITDDLLSSNDIVWVPNGDFESGNFANDWDAALTTFNDQTPDTWNIFTDALGNNVAGIGELSDIEAYATFGNMLRTRNLPDSGLPANKEFCFDYHLPANTKLEVWIRFGPSDNYERRWHHKLWESDEIVSETSASECVLLNYPNGFSELYDDHIEEAIDPFDGHIVDSADASLNFDSDPHKLLFRLVVTSPDYEYIVDSDFSDLAYVDNVELLNLDDEQVERIDLEQTESQNLFIRTNYRSLSSSWIEVLDWELNSTPFQGGEHGFDDASYWTSCFEISQNEDIMLLGAVQLTSLNIENGDSDSFMNIIHHDVRTSVFENNDPDGSSYLIGTDGSLSYTQDNGATWEHYGVVPTTQIYGFDKSRNLMLGGTLDNGFVLQRDDEMISHPGSDGGRVKFNDIGNVAVSTSNEFIHVRRINEQGVINTTEYAINELFSSPSDFYLDAEIEFNDHTFYQVKKHVYKYGEDNLLNGTLGTVIIEVPNESDTYLDEYGFETNYRGRLNAIALSKSNPDVMYIAESERMHNSDVVHVKYKVYKTTDAGTTWIDLTAPLPNNENQLLREAYLHFSIRDMIVSPTDPNKVWACFQGIGLDEEGEALSRVLYTEDGGITWVDISAGLAPFPIHHLLYQEGTNDRVYVGTDVGVYYKDASMAEWQCFNNGLPMCVVTDLALDECEDRLYCSTFGRGFWWTKPLPGMFEELTVTEETWDEDQLIEQNLVVAENESLTIENCTITMAANTRIYVEPGAELIIDNATITTGCEQGYWKGIEIEGIDDMEQLNQYHGKVVLRNDATIERAMNGVATEYWSVDQFKNGGGIIEAENSHFKDCLIGLKFAPYLDMLAEEWYDDIPNNAAVIRNCTFTWDDETYNYLDGTVGMETNGPIGIWLNEVKNLKIEGCYFRNYANHPMMDDDTKRGTGIHCNTGSVFVKALGSEENNDLDRNEFYGLTNPIWSITSNQSYVTRIDQALVYKCSRGMALQGQMFPQVTRSIFSIPAVANTDPGQLQYGIYLNECQNYEIEDNEFWGTGISANGNNIGRNVGIAVRNSQPLEGEEYSSMTLYHNKFYNMQASIIAMGANDSESFTDGLQIKCNTFIEEGNTVNQEEEYNIALTGSGARIAPIQGSPIGDDGPAGNSFTEVPASSNYYIDENAQGLDAYWHHTPSTNYKFVPDPASESVNPQNSYQEFSSSNSCPSDVSIFITDPNDHFEQYQLGSSQLQQLDSIYHGYVDQGNQLDLSAYINNSLHTSEEVRDQMLLLLPNSDQTIKDALNRLPHLNQWHMLQILLANSPLKPGMIEYIDESYLDEFYSNYLKASQNGGVSNKTIMESDIAFYSIKADGAKSDYLRKWLADEGTFNSEKIQTILSEPKQDAKHLAIDVLMFEGRYDDALIQLAAMPLNDRTQVDELLIVSRRDSLDIRSFGENEINELERIRDNYNVGTVKAAAVLEVIKGDKLSENILWPGTNRAFFRSGYSDVMSDLKLLSAYPNPSRGDCFISCLIIEGVSHAEIVLYSSDGQLIFTKPLDERNARSIIEIKSDFPTGLYEATLLFDGIVMQTIKIIVEP